MKIRNGIVINGDFYGLVKCTYELFSPEECGLCALFDFCRVSSPCRMPCLMFKGFFHNHFKRFSINHDGEQIIAPLIDYKLNGLIFDSVFYELQPNARCCLASCDLWEVCLEMQKELEGNLCNMFPDNERMVFKRTNYDIFEYDVFEVIEER